MNDVDVQHAALSILQHGGGAHTDSTSINLLPTSDGEVLSATLHKHGMASAAAATHGHLCPPRNEEHVYLAHLQTNRARYWYAYGSPPPAACWGCICTDAAAFAQHDTRTASKRAHLSHVHDTRPPPGILARAILTYTHCRPQDGFVTSPPSGANQRSAQHSSGAAASGGWKSATWRAIRANTTAQLADPTGAFRTFKAGRRRRYRDAKREKAAQAAFTTNLEFIVAENAKGTNPFVLGVTNLSDLSFEEFKAQYLMAPQKPPADVAAARQADAGAGTRAHLHRKGSRCARDAPVLANSACI